MLLYLHRVGEDFWFVEWWEQAQSAATESLVSQT